MKGVGVYVGGCMWLRMPTGALLAQRRRSSSGANNPRGRWTLTVAVHTPGRCSRVACPVGWYPKLRPIPYYPLSARQRAGGLLTSLPKGGRLMSSSVVPVRKMDSTPGSGAGLPSGVVSWCAGMGGRLDRSMGSEGMGSSSSSGSGGGPSSSGGGPSPSSCGSPS